MLRGSNKDCELSNKWVTGSSGRQKSLWIPKYSVWILTENLLSSSSVPTADRDSSPTTNPKLSTLQRFSCSTPLSQTNRYTKEQDYRPKATGRKTPTLASPVPGTPFLRPVHQVTLVPHVPIVRPAHQLHPGLVQRMLAQGVHPQHLPSLLQAGEFLTLAWVARTDEVLYHWRVLSLER